MAGIARSRPPAAPDTGSATTRKQFVVLTSHRLLFLTQTFLGGPGKQVLGEVPRAEVSPAEAKMGDGVALTFPRVDKKNAEALAG